MTREEYIERLNFMVFVLTNIPKLIEDMHIILEENDINQKDATSLLKKIVLSKYINEIKQLLENEVIDKNLYKLGCSMISDAITGYKKNV